MKELDDIFEEVNGHGKFQKILLYMILGPIITFLPFAWNAELLLLHQPDHWCHHQMTDGLNETELSLWKTCYLPQDPVNKSCQIYLPPVYDTAEKEDEFWNQQTFYGCPWSNTSGLNVRKSSPCKREWKYDQSEFKRTIVTDYNWVCNNSLKIQEQYSYNPIGILIGSMGWNYISDLYGRIKMFWISLTLIVVPMLVKSFLAQYYYVYSILNIIMYSGIMTVYQIPTSMLVEFVDESYRSWAVMYTWLTW